MPDVAIAKPMASSLLPFAVIIPIHWPDRRWPEVLDGLARQSATPRVLHVVSSGAREEDLDRVGAVGGDCMSIAARDFDHAGTRRAAIEALPSSIEVAVFLTQDAIPADPQAIAALLAPFADPTVAAAWGRQLPHDDATPVAAHARHYNYPETSRTVSLADAARLGIKVAFCSNSFSAYRLSALKRIGGFVAPTPLGEDMAAVGRLLKAGFRIAYVAEARVRHSHNYSAREEFRRYFDTGAFHALNPWLLADFGQPQGEGRRFVVDQLGYLWRRAPGSIPGALLATAAKWVGYQLGRRANSLPPSWRRRFGMNKNYWNQQTDARRPPVHPV